MGRIRGGRCGVGALSAVLLRNRDAMLPWESLLLAASPVVGRLFATLSMTGNLATYLSVAAVALILAVELECSPRFG